MKDKELRKALGICVGEIEALKMDVGSLQRQVSDMRNQPIGEVYCNSNTKCVNSLEPTQVNTDTWEWKITYNSDNSCWQKFSQKDIDDRVNGKIKIKGYWHDKKDCVFYNDVEKEKKKIEKQYKQGGRR